jgi:hypothetical protein
MEWQRNFGVLGMAGERAPAGAEGWTSRVNAPFSAAGENLLLIRAAARVSGFRWFARIAMCARTRV